MASKITHIQPIKVEDHKEMESWGKFKKRFEIAAFSVDFGKNVVEEDAGRKAASISQITRAAMLSTIGEEGIGDILQLWNRSERYQL